MEGATTSLDLKKHLLKAALSQSSQEGERLSWW